MARIYANLCESCNKNFFDVPKKQQASVRALIEGDGYVINDDGTVVLKPQEEAAESEE